MKKLKAFVRFDSNGRIVPEGPVLGYTPPKNGKWVEIASYIDCCTTGTTTTLDINCRFFRIDGNGNTVWQGIGCDGLPYSTGESLPGVETLFYCAQSITFSNRTFEDIGVCGDSCKKWLVSAAGYPTTIDYYDCEGVSGSLEISEPTEICAWYVVPNLGLTIEEIMAC